MGGIEGSHGAERKLGLRCREGEGQHPGVVE